MQAFGIPQKCWRQMNRNSGMKKTPKKTKNHTKVLHASPKKHSVVHWRQTYRAELDKLRSKDALAEAKAKTTITLKELRDAEKSAARRKDYAMAGALQAQHKRVAVLEQAEHAAAAVGDYDTAEALEEQANKLLRTLSSNETLKRYYAPQTG